ncbi:probable 28S ribosomal protein S16, mitochondrial [Leptopilina boulardi]|uniref:probable 28S ribosomal protein S16, mitochondrial n=1 Tax=Leptopilina boulardi TaxID=63433 RepID=UPI0021F5A05A|nr:probable 28S ribosomal protein S16, mitochondrial [Leptopilina boulardi]
MVRTPLHPASGTGVVLKKCAALAIRFVRYGCTNRPFYNIVVMERRLEQRQPPVEQVGSYDKIPNKYNERLLALNFERIMYWIGQGAHVSRPVLEIFGLAGFYPIHPRTYIHSSRNRKAAEKRRMEASTTSENETSAAS